MARVITDPTSLRSLLGDRKTGFVPTMGALHAGHAALIRRSAHENALTVVSVFVNPTQFDDPNDLARYPRDLDRDVAVAADAGADIVYAPDVTAVYPPGFSTFVEVAGLTERWEGAARPGHFRGVATVVTILLNTVRPRRAYFGEKDYQQLLVVRRLHRDLQLPGEIVGCPTVREADGLALSSRNARLTPQQRAEAVAIPRALFAMASAARAGEVSAARLLQLGQEHLAAPLSLIVEYLAIVDGETLDPVEHVAPGARAIIAARLGPVRLIDNVALLDEAAGSR
ncbi:MAG: pantothenate synthetase [Thermomicrobiales bacterium]|nr:MAG: pantothenate synthetase [Thermomicrobiales bacterium]